MQVLNSPYYSYQSYTAQNKCLYNNLNSDNLSFNGRSRLWRRPPLSRCLGLGKSGFKSNRQLRRPGVLDRLGYRAKQKVKKFMYGTFGLVIFSTILINSCSDKEVNKAKAGDIATNEGLSRKYKTELSVKKPDLETKEKNVRDIKSIEAEIKQLSQEDFGIQTKRLGELLLNNEDNPEIRDFLVQERIRIINEKLEENPEILDLICKYTEKYNEKMPHKLDPLLVVCQMEQESVFDPKAKNKKSGAEGLMQIMELTNKSLNRIYYKDKDDPRMQFDRPKNRSKMSDNIELGITLMLEDLSMFDGNYSHALAAYNANPQAVRKHDGVPPYKETKIYEKVIMETYNSIKDNPDLLDKDIRKKLDI